MKNPKDGFIRGRIRSLKFAFKGLWILVTTEDSIKAQLFFAFIATILGFYFDISAAEWSAQVLVIGLVLVAEGANTAIEEMADFVHPEFHKKIGLIKDIDTRIAKIKKDKIKVYKRKLSQLLSKNNSKKSSFLLKNKGSISDVNKAPVLIETNATETFATFMAEKNVIQ